MKIGYARVSTDEQTTDPQIDALTTHGCETIYQEHASGKNADRQELENCLKALRQGDTLTVWRLDRLGRNLADLIRIVNDLEARGVGFASLTESIDTTTPAGKLVFHVFAALAEFERNLIRERTIGTQGQVSRFPRTVLGQVSQSCFFNVPFQNAAHGRIVDIKGLSNLFHAVAVRGIGLHDGRVARWHGSEADQRRRNGAALQARYFCVS